VNRQRTHKRIISAIAFLVLFLIPGVKQDLHRLFVHSCFDVLVSRESVVLTPDNTCAECDYSLFVVKPTNILTLFVFVLFIQKVVLISQLKPYQSLLPSQRFLRGPPLY